MLVLSRKIGEEIVIDGSVRVQVVEVHDGQVRLGIEAPEYVPVDRPDVFDGRYAVYKNQQEMG